MTDKHFQHIKYNETLQVQESGIIGRLTGRNDAVYIRNRWQTEIDNSWAALMNMTHYLETCHDSIETICRFNDIARMRGEIQDVNVKRERLYSNVFKYIQQDQAYSERMWTIHQDMYKSQSSNSSNYSRSFKNVNVTHEEIKKYVSMYPKIEVKNDTQMIKDIEDHAEYKKSEYRKNVALLRDYFEQFKIEIIKCESKLSVYIKIKSEGIEQLKMSNYKGSLFHSLLSAQKKQELEIDTLKHRIEQVEHIISHYKEIRDKVEKELLLESKDIQRSLSSEYEFSNSLDMV